jgi:predicted Fe-Mo cluster-binding NifX family protein
MNQATETDPATITRIGVTSQNRKSVTEHAGRCRKFWIYAVQNGQITGKELVELDKEQSLHETAPALPEPLKGLDVLLVGGMGPGLSRRLETHGINAQVSKEADPDAAVAAFLTLTR